MKRQNAAPDNTPCKIQRLTSSAASKSEPAIATKITDLNDDCLVNIFGHLDLESLFNVAIANEWLRPAARIVYKKKFGGIMVLINECDEVRPSYPNNRLINSKMNPWNEIYIIGFEQCLLYLRCFGPSITRLIINYNGSKSHRYNHLHQYINDYCADSLTCLKFKYMPNVAAEQFRKVFNNVETVSFYDGVLGEQWPAFVKCFPNLRRLCFDDVHVANRLIGKPFELLQYLHVKNIQSDGLTTIQIVADLLSGARELEGLRIFQVEDCVRVHELLTMIKDCPSIISFVYILSKIDLIPVNPTEVERIVAKLPALIELNLPDYRFACDDAIALIRQLNSLEQIEFQMEEAKCADLKSQLDDGMWEVIADDDEGFDNKHTNVTLYRSATNDD